MFAWLCGQTEQYVEVGGQGLPVPATRVAEPYGFSPKLATRTAPKH